MDERKVILERLRKKEQEIQSLEERLRSAKVYVQALQDVLKATEKSPPSHTVTEATLKPGSAVARVRDQILAAKIPIHINMLIEGLGRDVTKASRASLVSSLAAYVRKGEIFTRPAPNTFGLLELGHTEENTMSSAPQPPEGFGRIVQTASQHRREIEARNMNDEEDSPF
ncbi:MAG: hypothetical protein HZA66_04000 [Rhodopseudomonas palustris]|uniref:Uncharacterized protein n=1 Tax=Rhodopseudomonas palustris TaxID=1076 RepID=A0A933RUP1_RHOPL|nr:hypothetical protein [Rhodopseudomonas palustris]